MELGCSSAPICQVSTELTSRALGPNGLDGLTEALLKGSRKPMKAFFKREEMPRRAKVYRRGPAPQCESPIAPGVPTSTPELSYVSCVTSQHSSTSTVVGINTTTFHSSDISVAETWTTVSNSENIQEPPQDIPEPNPGADITSDQNTDDIHPVDDSGPPENAFGDTISSLKRWGVTLVHDIRSPLRRRKIRRNKKVDHSYKPDLPSDIRKPPLPRPINTPELLTYALSRPNTSRRFEQLNLEGGRGPPPYLSKKTLDKLDELERREIDLQKEISKLQKEKARVLERGEREDYKERYNKNAAESLEKTDSEKDKEEGNGTKEESLVKAMWIKAKSSRIVQIFIDA